MFHKNVFIIRFLLTVSKFTTHYFTYSLLSSNLPSKLAQINCPLFPPPENINSGPSCQTQNMSSASVFRIIVFSTFAHDTYSMVEVRERLGGMQTPVSGMKVRLATCLSTLLISTVLHKGNTACCVSTLALGITCKMGNCPSLGFKAVEVRHLLNLKGSIS